MPQLARRLRPPRKTAELPAADSKQSILYPLDLAYARSGLESPHARVLSASEIPPPYRSLLAHEQAMTLTLERHFRARVVLRALSTFAQGRWYSRRVLLVREDSGRPVEMGAFRMNLNALEPHIRTQILANEVPLGRLLRSGGVDYRSRPKLFLAVTPNSEMMGVFWMRKPRTLYGRQTEVTLDGKKIGDIVEVLPRI